MLVGLFAGLIVPDGFAQSALWCTTDGSDAAEWFSPLPLPRFTAFDFVFTPDLTTQPIEHLETSASPDSAIEKIGAATISKTIASITSPEVPSVIHAAYDAAQLPSETSAIATFSSSAVDSGTSTPPALLFGGSDAFGSPLLGTQTTFASVASSGTTLASAEQFSGNQSDAAVEANSAVLQSPGVNAPAATRTKANNTNNLNLTTSWTGGVVPGSGDIALWDSTVTGANTVSLGADLNFGEIQITNPGGVFPTVTINAGNTLTLSGVSGIGIDMSSTALLVINCNVMLGAAQTWQNGNSSGNTLTLNAVDNGGNLLTLSGTGGINIQGVITGAGGLTHNGTGQVNLLNSANTYTGVTTLDGGGNTVVTSLANINTASPIGKGSVAGSAADLVFGGGILYFTGASSASSTNRLFTIGDTNGLTATIYSDTATAANSLSFTNTGAIAFGGSGARTLTLNGSNTGNNTFAPVLGDGPGGATRLVKAGTGSWTLTGANTYTGGTQVLSGTLTVSGSGTLGANSGSLEVDSFSSTSTTILNLNIDQTVGSLLGTIFGGGSATINIASGKTLTVNQSTTTTYAGVLAGVGSFTKSGVGTLTLSGANTYSGGTTLSSGTLNINNASALGTGAFTIGGGTIDNTTNAALTLTTSDAINIGTSFTFGGTQNLNLGTGAVSDNGNYTITLNGSSKTLTLGGTMSNTSGGDQTLTVNGAGNTLVLGGYTLNNTSIGSDTINGTGNVTIAGPITNGSAFQGRLIYNGTGTLTFSGANTFTGQLTLSSGTLRMSGSGTLGPPGGGNVTVNGGTLDLNGTNQSTFLLTGVGGTILNNATGTNVTLTVGGNGGNAGHYFGIIADNSSGTGTVALTKVGNNQFTLEGNNTYSGTTTISGGELQIGLSFTAGTLGTGNVVDNASLNFNRTNSLTVSNLISGSGVVLQSGTGTTTLSGANTYTGGTQVNGGTLLINSNQSAATGAVAVNNTGTLGGTGTIGGATTINSSAVILGGTGASASGTLTVANSLTLQSNSIIELALGASGAHSTLARTGSGTWSFQSNQAFTFIELGTTTGIYQNIITGLAADPGTENTWTITNSGWAGTFMWDGANIDLTLTAVPEPSTWTGAALALIGVVRWHRRRGLRG